MEHIQKIRGLGIDQRSQARDYIFDMIRQMAKLARRNGERSIAIQLEAIIAARRAAAEDRSFS